ncbi:amino acid ABC transporter substrate-binding protein [Undibacterium sp. TS12]|uniref:amino acid ABC transporter substrate-binding protein n=1 Tax=Undibacterium sp. TS12 TaxID=2908202 RepID=UPI001F4C616C|nr:amino acid ABC transporter substrate-binding protein [Undibacterium sp. TS12]MCH8622434.1 amino acid ABC transporter substrate-binding protein [Undibacterium sp. TS12]
MKKIISIGSGFMLVLVSLMLAIPGVSCAADTLTKIRESQVITFAYLQAAPFSYTSEDNRVNGYSIDFCLRIANAIKKELKLSNLKIQYLPVDSVSRFSSIIDGKADIECGATTNTAERRRRVSFTIPHFFSSVRMIVKKDKGIRNWQDLKGKTIVTTRNATTLELVNARSNVRSLNIRLLEGQDHDASFRMVEQDQADAFAMDDVLLFSLRAKARNPDEFIVVGDPLSVEPYSLMLRKDDVAFKNLVDREMMRLITDGEFEKLYRDWFTRPTGINKMNLAMPMGFLLRDSIRFPSDKTAD